MTALWKNTTKSGMEVWKGTCKDEIRLPPGTKIMIFPNKHKKSERDPDFQIMIAKPEVYEPKESKPVHMTDEEYYF